MTEDEKREQQRIADAIRNMRLPAGLEGIGRAEDHVHDPDAHPSGARADSRHSVPGTIIPGAPAPAAPGGEEAERVRRLVSEEPGDERAGDEAPGEEPAP